ncbi:hypothetical protein EDE15_3435 [Edaphobacter aggregans]|uniref:Uncharacterized protein n=1 Tax=Edaphobacter aggregans TaxID=570835 RepID=A0A428MLX6_9BACT|nr:hypothetical protein EDE15_3435 [Edaphobacter aggregans]
MILDFNGLPNLTLRTPPPLSVIFSKSALLHEIDISSMRPEWLTFRNRKSFVYIANMGERSAVQLKSGESISQSDPGLRRPTPPAMSGRKPEACPALSSAVALDPRDSFELRVAGRPRHKTGRGVGQYGGSQCGGTLRSLRKIDRTNPFEPLKFLKSSGAEISPFGLDCTTYWAAQHLQKMARENSTQFVRAHISNIVGSKNVKKTWDRFAPYLCSGESGIDEQILHQLFLRSMMLQMGFCGD